MTSRFSGPQGRRRMHSYREQKRIEAELRQEDVPVERTRKYRIEMAYAALASDPEYQEYSKAARKRRRG